MTDEPAKGPPGGLTPHVCIPDGRAADAVAWYQSALGATLHMQSLEEGGPRVMHAYLTVNDGALFVNDAFPEYDATIARPGGFALHLQVPDADAVWDRAMAAGATARVPLADMFWGDRYGQFTDPFGVTWSLGQTLSPQ